MKQFHFVDLLLKLRVIDRNVVEDVVVHWERIEGCRFFKFNLIDSDSNSFYS